MGPERETACPGTCRQPAVYHPMDPFCSQLALLRSALLRSAHSRLRNPHWAEDAVSETLLAALQSRPDFNEPSRVRAWLLGILRHKVVDQLRQHLGPAKNLPLAECANADAAELSDACPLADPQRRVADRQFISALQRQLADLPKMHAHAFFLRECLGKDTAEICDELAISAGNLGVVLHRTRHRLRRALSAHHTKSHHAFSAQRANG